MEGKIHYKILPGDKLIIEVVTGDVAWKEYLEYKKTLVQDPDYNTTYNVITDISRQTLGYNRKMLSDLDDYVDFLQRNNIMLEHKTAVITTTPDHYLHADSFKRAYNINSMDIRIFSSLEASLFWLGLTFATIDKINNIYKEFKLD